MTTTMTTPETRPAASPEATSQAAAPTIGVFDSGFGGLTVLRALIQRLPQARFAFLGDTARLPYGSKSRRTIARYAVQSAQFLVREQGAQFLVIACNTASALALDAIQDAVPVPVLGVIEPGASAARAASRTGDVLVIATDATVHSHAYAVACRAQGLRALEKACPLLVPLVEEGWTGASAFPASCTGPSAAPAASAPPQVAVTAEVIRIYLEELTAEAAAQGLNPDTLVLGCTHYPLLRPLLERILARAVPAGLQVIDSPTPPPTPPCSSSPSTTWNNVRRPRRTRPQRTRARSSIFAASPPTPSTNSSASVPASWAALPARSSWSTSAADRPAAGPIPQSKQSSCALLSTPSGQFHRAGLRLIQENQSPTVSRYLRRMASGGSQPRDL